MVVTEGEYQKLFRDEEIRSALTGDGSGKVDSGRLDRRLRQFYPQATAWETHGIGTNIIFAYVAAMRKPYHDKLNSDSGSQG